MAELSPSDNTVLVFDWGNTLMKVFPEYSGPMAAWPQVAEVDGAGEALAALAGQHTMVVATNASDSRADEVWQALRQVGLGDYFKAVFTSNELGHRKPELAFFRQIESVLARPPYAMVMVGDDFRADVLGAHAAGWKTIWYNPQRQAAPGLLPLHTAEIDDMRRLPQALDRLALPDIATCLNWMVERGAPYNLLAHVQLVAAAAYQLAAWLRERGVALDPLLTQRAGLLHDLAKMDAIRMQREKGIHYDHAAMASRLLLERSQPELAAIADRHMLFQDPQDPRRPQTWEEKLVHFADKLAEGARLVDLDERVVALKGRYPSAAKEIEASMPNLLSMQAEICDALEITPEEMVARLKESLGFP